MRSMLTVGGGFLVALCFLRGAVAEEPAPAPGAEGEVDISRERLEEILGLYLAEDDRREREELVGAILAMEKAGLDASTLYEVMALGMAFPRDAGVFAEPGKTGAPAIEWKGRRVQPRELGSDAPNVYQIVFPRDYESHGGVIYPVVLDLGDGIARGLTAGTGNEGVITVFIYPDAIPPQGLVASREGQSLVLSILRDLPLRAYIDPDRIFLTGGGRQAKAAYYIAEHYPHLFAGAIPYNGKIGDYRIFERNVANLGWMFVTRNPGPQTLDTYEFNFDNFERLKAKGARTMFRLLDVDTEPRSFFGDAHEFVRDTVRDPWPKSLNVRMNDDDHDEHYWIGIDKVKAPGRPKVIKIQGEFGQVTDTRTVNSKLAEASARCSEDRRRIDIDTDNVAHLTVFLSPELVDFEQEVEIVVNGKSRYKEKPKPSFRLMLLRYRATLDASNLPWCRVQILDV